MNSCQSVFCPYSILFYLRYYGSDLRAVALGEVRQLVHALLVEIDFLPVGVLAVRERAVGEGERMERGHEGVWTREVVVERLYRRIPFDVREVVAERVAGLVEKRNDVVSLAVEHFVLLAHEAVLLHYELNVFLNYGRTTTTSQRGKPEDVVVLVRKRRRKRRRGT